MTNHSDKLMNYEEGVEFMKSISKKGEAQQSFQYGDLIVSYPGYKGNGDYRLSHVKNNEAPKHTDVVDLIESICTRENRDAIVLDLEEIYTHGLRANTTIIDSSLKTKIFWITLQEDINYPRPRYQGICLPLQRFFEATLICLNMIDKSNLYIRTNNHGGSVPKLLDLKGLQIPLFYQ